MPRKISEERTRKEMMDPQLEQAGWYLRDHSKVKIEIPVDGYDAEPWNGVSDYCCIAKTGKYWRCWRGSSRCVGRWANPPGRWMGCLRVCWRNLLTVDGRRHLHLRAGASVDGATVCGLRSSGLLCG